MFLESVQPPDIVILLFVIPAAIFQSRFKASASGFEAVGSVVISILIGYLVGWAIYSHYKQSIVITASAAALASYLGTALQLAAHEFGGKLAKKPLLILKWILPSAFEKLFADESKPPQPD